MVFSTSKAFLAVLIAAYPLSEEVRQVPRMDNFIALAIVLAGLFLLGGFLGAWIDRRRQRRNSD